MEQRLRLSLAGFLLGLLNRFNQKLCKRVYTKTACKANTKLETVPILGRGVGLGFRDKVPILSLVCCIVRSGLDLKHSSIICAWHEVDQWIEAFV